MPAVAEDAPPSATWSVILRLLIDGAVPAVVLKQVLVRPVQGGTGLFLRSERRSRSRHIDAHQFRRNYRERRRCAWTGDTGWASCWCLAEESTAKNDVERMATGLDHWMQGCSDRLAAAAHDNIGSRCRKRKVPRSAAVVLPPLNRPLLSMLLSSLVHGVPLTKSWGIGLLRRRRPRWNSDEEVPPMTKLGAIVSLARTSSSANLPSPNREPRNSVAAKAVDGRDPRCRIPGRNSQICGAGADDLSPGLRPSATTNGVGISVRAFGRVGQA
ncbi:uncharacterized protein ATNIH1004_001982 [Aspergillus tanneri]|uniref:Uncharacterized protein n=1 Tax=Aspergillus tanneri TaxID=1220188 RepID=A0A5M9M7B3_9EURO|nr:uncharacterized protein ATNIH1004_001982 [Aspergillus tanneri]KAA8641380.1 hypothetical protein ATNIH1004_001982 [Aspergillus tanneri]